MPRSGINIVVNVAGLQKMKRTALKNARESAGMRSAARNSARRAITILKKTTTTWNHKVTFQFAIGGKIGGDEVVYTVWTDDQIWHYLDRGTSRKPVTVTPDFQPKTEPFFYGSRPGAGLVFHMRDDRGDIRWTGGITARQWSSAPFFRGHLRAELLKDMEYQFSKIARAING